MKSWSNNKGVAAIEYGLMAASISVALMASLSQTGSSISETFCYINVAITGQGNCTGQSSGNGSNTSSGQGQTLSQQASARGQWSYSNTIVPPSQALLSSINTMKQQNNWQSLDYIPYEFGGYFQPNRAYSISDNSNASGIKYLNTIMQTIDSLNAKSQVIGVTGITALISSGYHDVSDPVQVMQLIQNKTAYSYRDSATTIFTADGKSYLIQR